jgi:hypothetical protein
MSKNLPSCFTGFKKSDSDMFGLLINSWEINYKSKNGMCPFGHPKFKACCYKYFCLVFSTKLNITSFESFLG